MKKIIVATVAVAVMAIFISSAQAITVKASIKKGAVTVTGSAAALNAAISWEGVNVATASTKGKFKFSGAPVPADCVGKLSDGVTNIDVPLANCTPTGGVLETGQTTCYNSVGTVINCPGTGQDGEVQKGRTRSYTVDVIGLTITDNATGLEWEVLCALLIGSCPVINRVDNAIFHWDEAFQKIADLNNANFAGHNDWRLPNINELQTLVDYGRIDPAIDPVFFSFTSFTQSSLYWSSTSYQNLPSRAWGVDFNDGRVLPNSKLGGSFVDYVRAVRGGS